MSIDITSVDTVIIYNFQIISNDKTEDFIEWIQGDNENYCNMINNIEKETGISFCSIVDNDIIKMKSDEIYLFMKNLHKLCGRYGCNKMQFSPKTEGYLQLFKKEPFDIYIAKNNKKKYICFDINLPRDVKVNDLKKYSFPQYKHIQCISNFPAKKGDKCNFYMSDQKKTGYKLTEYEFNDLVEVIRLSIVSNKQKEILLKKGTSIKI